MVFWGLCIADFALSFHLCLHQQPPHTENLVQITPQCLWSRVWSHGDAQTHIPLPQHDLWHIANAAGLGLIFRQRNSLWCSTLYPITPPTDGHALCFNFSATANNATKKCPCHMSLDTGSFISIKDSQEYIYWLQSLASFLHTLFKGYKDTLF